MANVTLEPVVDSIHRLARKWANRDATDVDLLNRFVASRDEDAFAGLLATRKLLQERLTRRGITLAAVLTAGAVSGATASAAIPTTLLGSTAQAALQFALGQTSGIAGAASAATLANGVLKTMAWQKFKAVSLILLATTFLGAGTTIASYRAFAAEPSFAAEPMTLKPETNRDSQEAGLAERKQPLVDLNCDPMPEGVSARLGTMRWRHEHSHDGLFAHFSPDGKIVATCTRFIRLWTVADGKLLREIGGDRSETWDSPVFSPDGKWLAAYINRQLAASVDRQLVLIDVATGTPGQGLFTNDELSRFHVGLVGFSPDGKPLAVGWSDDDIYLFDFPNGRRLRKVPKAIKNWISMALTADSKTLMAVSVDRKIGRWDTQTGDLIGVADLDLSAPGWGDAYTVIRFSPDGTTVAVKAGAPAPVVVFDTATGKQRLCLKGESEAYPGFAYSPDGRTLLAKFRAEGGTISLWDTRTGERKRRLNIPDDNSQYFEISPDGKTLLAADQGPTVRLWDMDTGQRLTPRQGHENTVFHVVVTPDSKTLISASRDGQILVWDLASSRVTRQLAPVRELAPVLEEVTGLTLRPRTDEVASWTWNGVIRFHNWRTGQESRRIDINELFDKKEPSNKGSRRFLYGLECSPDGRQALIFVGQIPGAPPYS